MTEVNNIILAHIDPDGILSAHIAKKIWGGKVIFQKWYQFGVTTEDIDTFRQYKPKNVIVLDLGADEKTLENLSLLDQETKIWLVDNHPPEDMDGVLKYASDRFNISTTEDNCTVGTLCDTFGETMLEGTDLEWAKMWAALGIYADVKTDSKQGKPMYDSIVSNFKILGTKLLKWGKSYEEDGKGTKGYGTQKRELIPTLSKFFNTPRRIIRHYGAYTGLRACEEIEIANDITLPEQMFTPREQALYPATHLIKTWVADWDKNWTSVFKADNIRYWDMDIFTISVINHPWNLGSQVANTKARDTYAPKAHFCINKYNTDGYITISGRKPDDDNLDIGKTLARVQELSDGKIKGGGLSMAGSGHAPADTSVNDIISLLQKAVDEE